ncbi:MAG: HEAT repeat domain-containing protein, partial [Planctomycetales bacterium]
IHAARLSESLGRDSPEVRAKLRGLVEDKDPGVRYQAAFSLGAFRGPARRDALTTLIQRDGSNRWVRAAVQSSLAEGAGDVFVALSADKSFRESEHGKTMLASLAAQIGAQDRTSEIALLLQGLQLIPPSRRELRQAITQALVQNARKETRRRLSAAGSGALGALLSKMLQEARTTAGDPDRKTEERAEAIRSLALAGFEDAATQALFGKLLKLRQPRPIQAAALDALERIDHPEIPATILRAWPGLSPRLKARATEALFSRPSWTLAALAALETGEIHQGDVAAARIALLRDHPNPRIQEQAGRLLSRIAAPRRADVVARYQAALRKQGDAGRGKLVFKKVCSACHNVQESGTAIGADLTGIGAKPPDAILLNILDPNREVKPKFVNYTIQTKDGRSLAGMIV